jgi:hypothetical protein
MGQRENGKGGGMRNRHLRSGLEKSLHKNLNILY